MSFTSAAKKAYREARYAVPVIPPASTDDFKDYADGDFTPSSEEIGSSASPVRTIHDVLDFLQNVVEEVSEWIDRETGEGHSALPQKRNPVIVQTIPISAMEWKVTRYSITQAAMVLRRRDNRRRGVIVNWGPNPVYVSNEAITGSTLPTPNSRIIPVSSLAGNVYFPVEFNHQDEIWAAPDNLGASMIEVSEEYGIPER